MHIVYPVTMLCLHSPIGRLHQVVALRCRQQDGLDTICRACTV